MTSRSECLTGTGMDQVASAMAIKKLFGRHPENVSLAQNDDQAVRVFKGTVFKWHVVLYVSKSLEGYFHN